MVNLPDLQDFAAAKTFQKSNFWPIIFLGPETCVLTKIIFQFENWHTVIVVIFDFQLYSMINLLLFKFEHS